jgi:hypothetical protein
MKRQIGIVAMICAALAILLPNIAKADSISTFNITGTSSALQGQSCGLACSFSGAMTVDVTTGIVTSIDIAFPDLATFNTLDIARNSGNEYNLVLLNGGAQDLAIVFTTATPGSLVGFSGGVITQGATVTLSTNDPNYAITSGTITSQTVAATPEPSSLVLAGTGILGFAGVVRRRIL